MSVWDGFGQCLNCPKINLSISSLQLGKLDIGLPRAGARDRNLAICDIAVKRAARPPDSFGGLRHLQSGGCSVLSIVGQFRTASDMRAHEAVRHSEGNGVDDRRSDSSDANRARSLPASVPSRSGVEVCEEAESVSRDRMAYRVRPRAGRLPA